MLISMAQAHDMLSIVIQSRLVPILRGSPGVGKSQLAYKLAEKFNLKLIDVRLSQADPTDLSGFPSIMGKKAGYIPMETFPIEGDPIPEGYSGWLIFFDEFTSAFPAVMAASYKIILDRMIGTHKLHNNVAMMCAGNLETDNAITQPMGTAMQSRLIHFTLSSDHEEFCDWSEANDIDFRIPSFIRFKPGNLHAFKSDHTDDTFACPRTWEFVSKLLKNVKADDKLALPILAGAITEGMAREFLGFCKIYKTLPTIATISGMPDTVPMPTEPSILYALTGSISHNVTVENITNLMRFIVRMPLEYQVVCLRGAVRRNRALIPHAAIQTWYKSSATALF
jgi:hypothetical protein